MIELDFEDKCTLINDLFNKLTITSGRSDKEALVYKFKLDNPTLVNDLDYCFEVLAGKHKLGYTYELFVEYKQHIDTNYKTIEDLINCLQGIPPTGDAAEKAFLLTPENITTFIEKLVNREFKLGYSNKEIMISKLSPMLAKRYPETFRPEHDYYIQEKLDGNRCIAYFDFEGDKAGLYNSPAECWHFRSRSGKPLNVDFDMSWADPDLIFDGEVMTLDHAGTRDFNRTSGIINSKYCDKTGLHYFIYDIIDEKLTYEERKKILDGMGSEPSEDCSILPVLDKIPLYKNIEYNYRLDEWLDKITEKGGEGIMLRDPDGVYQCGVRSNYLIKYKKVQTMDLRIVGWNEGNGKYIDAIGSFLCKSDDGSIRVNVSGMPDSIHFSSPDDWIGKIIEVAYFSISESNGKSYKSLRFPRLKRVRDDKNTTSIY